jgi:hypothetical protein
MSQGFRLILERIGSRDFSHAGCANYEKHPPAALARAGQIQTGLCARN